MTTGRHQQIPLKQLTPSPLNHRKHFDQAKMDELESSIRAQGVVVPIIARVLNGKDSFEIVAGERRFRAAKAAGLPDIPAIVRELTDAQALELQVIENGQRVDVHPLEEAEGYEALLNCEGGEPYTVERIVEKVGKSKGTVYARLKLLSLTKEGRTAFYDGRLDSSRALLLARIPVPDLQNKALEEILEGSEDFGDGPMSYREAADHVQWHYMLRLKEAPFKTGDPDLLPSAGACTTCLKRTGNQPELFADVQSADTCTDPPCFAAKRDAHLEVLRQGAIAKGKEVVPANARGYVKLDDRVKGDWSGRTYRQVLGKSAPAPVLMPAATDDKAKLVEVVKKADVKDVVAKKLAAQRSSGGGSNRDWERERAEMAVYQKALFTHICAKIPEKIGREELRVLVDDALNGEVDVELIEELFIPKPAKGSAPRLLEVLDKLDADALGRLLVAATLSRDCDGYGHGEDRLAEVAKTYKIDVAAIKKSVKATTKAAAEPAEAVE